MPQMRSGDRARNNAAALLNVGAEDSRLRMQTIIRLRWFGVGGQLVTVAAVYWWLGFDFPVGWCLLMIAASAWLNVILRVRYPGRHRLSNAFASGLLAYDVGELAALLYLTGGLENPFAFLIVAPVTVSAATLPAAITLALGAFSLAMAGLLVFWHLPLPWAESEIFALPILYKVGILGSIAAGMTFLALYAARLAKDSRLMSEALAATEQVLAREQKLHALDDMAAAAAHELGTPLATIALVTKELEKSGSAWPELNEDIVLLRSQAERCREILRTLTRRSEEQDPHHVSLPVKQLLQEAAAAHTITDVQIALTAEPFDGVDEASQKEPVGQRQPGVIYGLGNIIENAIDFARETVTIDARWDERELEVRIADDGPGFAVEVMDSLGEPYVTTRGSGLQQRRTGKEAAGLGLGFFIAKTLLERSGAQVSLSNKTAPERGAVVTVTWSREAFDLPSTTNFGHATAVERALAPFAVPPAADA